MLQMIYHGSNLVPESLEIGEPKISGTAEFDELEPAYIIAFAGQQYGNVGETISQSGFKYNGILSGITFFLCSTIEQVQNNMALINADTTYNSQQNVITIFSIPRLALQTWVNIIENPSGTLPDQAILVMYGKKLTENWKEPPITKTLVSTPSTIDGYTPRNQKLRQYPYLYLGFNPANGTSKIFRYEDFASGTPSFKIMSEVNPNPSVYFIPQNYRGQSGDSLSDAVALGGYPTISYKTDTFNSWLAQNKNFVEINRERENLSYNQTKQKQALSAISSVGELAGSAITGNLGGVANSISNLAGLGIESTSNEKSHELNIREQMAQIEVQQLVPDNVTMSSSNATLLGYEQIDKNIFTRYNIKRQFAEKIDLYFDMYGYQTNTLKVPNINNRPNWNYIKTLSANINGNIPQMDLAEIKELFNSGITLWHNPNNFKNYSVNNR